MGQEALIIIIIIYSRSSALKTSSHEIHLKVVIQLEVHPSQLTIRITFIGTVHEIFFFFLRFC